MSRRVLISPLFCLLNISLTRKKQVRISFIGLFSQGKTRIHLNFSYFVSASIDNSYYKIIHMASPLKFHENTYTWVFYWDFQSVNYCTDWLTNIVWKSDFLISYCCFYQLVLFLYNILNWSNNFYQLLLNLNTTK